MARKRRPVRYRRPRSRSTADPSESKTAAAEAAGRNDTGSRGVLSQAAFWLGLAAVGCVYLVLKMYAVWPYAGDEHIYLYQAQLIADGFTPYRDFAFAHPPVQALFTALIFKVFGYSFVLSRFLPFLWCLAGGVLLGLIVRRELGVLAAVLAAAFYLLAYETLRSSSHYTGVNTTIAIFLGAVYAARRGATLATAVLSTLAVFTRLYAAPGVLALVLFEFLGDHRRGLRLVLWGAVCAVVASLAVGLWCGFDQVYENLLLYHAQKTPMKDGALVNMRTTVLFHNATLVLAFGLGIPALAERLLSRYSQNSQNSQNSQSRGASASSWSRWRGVLTERGSGILVLSLLTAAIFLAVLLDLDRVFMYYFVPAFPFFAIIGGWLFSRWIMFVVLFVRSRGRLRATGVPGPVVVGGAVLFALFAIGFQQSPDLEKQLGYYQREMNKPASQRVHSYTRQPGRLPAPVDELLARLFWEPTRTIGERYHSFTYLLWHESRHLDIVDDVVDFIQKETSADGEIFGDSGTVPLFALRSGRRIAANEVDTNIQRYRSGVASPQELIDSIDNEKTELIILRHRFGVSGVAELQQLMARKYTMVKQLRSSTGRVFYLHKRNDRS